MYRDNFVQSLQQELIDLAKDKLSDIALRHQYSEVALDNVIKWQPTVLVLGNYSSGKSTLINELLELPVQKTGQAPTDDSFTVITYGQKNSDNSTSERDGSVLLSDPSYPFEKLKRHGSRFTAHFRLKTVDAPILKDLAIIDTPGMLDSSSEFDRGYDYQEVIADLSQVADLVLVLFDPHKAGTVGETHQSLKKTLPSATFENQVVFVLNRIDECASLPDLIRVYGTLCWNLAQMTGRKDIPPIMLTYSNNMAPSSVDARWDYLKHLENERAMLKERIVSIPKYRLDNLSTYIENHTFQLQTLLESLLSYAKKRRSKVVKSHLWGWGLGAVAGFLSFAGFSLGWLANGMGVETHIIISLGLAIGVGVLWGLFIPNWVRRLFKHEILVDLDQLINLKTLAKEESWRKVVGTVHEIIKGDEIKLKIGTLKQDLKTLEATMKRVTKDIRPAIREIENDRFANS